MLKIYIFVCFTAIVFAKSSENDERLIVFDITYERIHNETYVTCDHQVNKDVHEYTVNEGEEYYISIIYSSYINNFTCVNTADNAITIIDLHHLDYYKNMSTFKAGEKMHGIWNCTILSHIHVDGIKPRVTADNNDTYAAAYCSMKIRFRNKKPPQTILVNNMVLKTAIVPSLVSDYDFTAEYRYADGDFVNVTCANFVTTHSVTIRYAYADKLSDHFNSAEETSNNVAGFIARMHSEHSYSFMTCTCRGALDDVTVMVQFILSEFRNKMTVNINGMDIRYGTNKDDYADIEYKFTPGEPISVICGVSRQDVRLTILKFQDFENLSAKKNVLVPNKMTEIKFVSSEYFHKKKFRCGFDNKADQKVLIIEIMFTKAEQSLDCFPIGLQVPSEGTAMELYYKKKLRVIYYNFEEGEILNLKCKHLKHNNLNPQCDTIIRHGPVTMLHFLYTPANINKEQDVDIEYSLKLTEKHKNTVISCYLEDFIDVNNKHDVIREIRVILNKKEFTTTTSTSTARPEMVTPTTTLSPDPQPESADDPSLAIKIQAVTVTVVSVVIVCVSTVIIKTRKKKQAQRSAHNPNYENLQNPTEANIPAYPAQWDSQYAVPADQRPQDTTYSVPFQAEAAYATAVPKSKRNKNAPDPTYAVLGIKNQGTNNVYKETDDPNYSEVYANRKEQSYAQVLPKVLRDTFKRQNNPYANVGDETSYANAGPEPMYCEPNVPKNNSPYANVDSERYANSRGNEYVEPTYCEPPAKAKGKK